MTNHARRRRSARAPRHLAAVPALVPPGYRHAEAFCLMTYVAEDGSGESEVLWNSRDGVTPYVIRLRSGKYARHAMQLARRAEKFVPPAGMRIFVDLTPELAQKYAHENAAKWWDDPDLGPQARRMYATPEDMAAVLVSDYLRPGAPAIVEAEGPVVPFASFRPPGDRIPGRDA